MAVSWSGGTGNTAGRELDPGEKVLHQRNRRGRDSGLTLARVIGIGVPGRAPPPSTPSDEGRDHWEGTVAQSSRTPAKWGRVLGASAAGGGGAAVAWLTHPTAGVWFAAVLVSVGVVIVVTALYAPKDNSERAFRLLRLITGRPEPAQQRSRKSRSRGSLPGAASGRAQPRRPRHPRSARPGNLVARQGDEE